MKQRTDNLGNRPRYAIARATRVMVLFAALLLCILGLFTALLGTTQPASAGTVSGAATHTPTAGRNDGSGLPGSGPEGTVAPGGLNGPAGWEVDALRDLAEVRDWPPFVNRDANGRLTVQQSEPGIEASLALIRPFDYRSGATAAFMAEQDDARLSGFRISADTFYTYPAYWAVSYDIDGQPLEMRFHWLANTWIMGAEVERTGVRTSDVRSIGQQLLALAIQYGLPAPPSATQPTATVLLTTTPVATRSPATCRISFDDVSSGHWAYNFIHELACKGVVSGYSDGTFRPQKSTTRAQLAKMLVIAEEWSTISPSRPTFDDVGQGHTFYRFIETAHARGIISGYANGTFRPDDFVTRAQVAKMIVGARGWPLRVSSPVTLCDVGADHWARDFIQGSIQRGIFTGYGDGCFQPDAPATRAQLAKVLTLAHR
ncbi:MAG: S-layer homology domain-containing protein [Chloroflexia bacterium]